MSKTIISSEEDSDFDNVIRSLSDPNLYKGEIVPDSDGPPDDWETPTVMSVLKDEEKMLDEALKAIKHNLDLNRELLESAANTATSSGDADHIESYASVTKSNVELIKAMTSIMHSKKQLDQKMKITEMQIKSKEKIADMKIRNNPKVIGDGKPNLQQTNNFIFRADPTEVLKLLNAPAAEQAAQLQTLMDAEVV